MGVNGEALQLHIVYKIAVFFSYKSRKNPYQYYKSCENPYQVLQVTCAASERAMKLKVRMINTIIQAIPEKISLVCCRWHCYLCCALVTVQMATNS